MKKLRFGEVQFRLRKTFSTEGELERLDNMEFLLCGQRKFVRGRVLDWARSCLIAAVLVLGLTGCGREEIRVYRVAKEVEPAPRAHGHASSSGAGRPRPHLHYETPQGWVERDPGSMSVARFSVPGKSGQPGDVAVVPLPGMRASTKEIVDLWRSQVGLGPVSEEELPRLTEQVQIAGAAGEMFDLVGADPSGEGNSKMRILVAMLKDPQATWFFKMTGDEATVQEHKSAFVAFLKDVEIDYSDHGASGQTSSSASASEGASSGSEAEAKPEWTIPSGWSEAPPTQMLLAKFVASGEGNDKAEVTVSVFPGDVGGNLANVNRWRGQVGLSPAEPAEVDGMLAPIEAAGGRALLVDMTGPAKSDAKAVRLVGVILPRGSRTWFFKMTGPEPVVHREKAAFVEFVKTSKFSHAH